MTEPSSRRNAARKPPPTYPFRQYGLLISENRPDHAAALEAELVVARAERAVALAELPLNRQVERFALEGVPISLSTVADAIGSCCHVLDPLLRRIEAHTFAAERVHGDDTTVPVLAAGKTDTGRIWTYVRDDAPFGGSAPPSAMFYYSRDRAGQHPQAHLANYSGILQADAYTGYTQLYLPDRSPGPIYEAACWAHARRPFFALADLEANARRKAQGKRPAVYLADRSQDGSAD